MSIRFSLTINDPEHSMSPENGVPMCDLGALLCDMFAATDPGDKSKCIMYGVSNHGYTPELITDSNLRYERYVDIHQRIHERGIEDLNNLEAKYARTLKRILKNRLFLEPYDKDQKLITTIHPSEIKNTVNGYYNLTTVYGTISEMGSPSLDKSTHIYLHETNYKIFTTKEQDSALRPNYRIGRLRLKLRQKRSLDTDRVISATLIAFEPMTGLSLVESLATMPDDDFEAFAGMDDQSDLFEYLDK